MAVMAGEARMCTRYHQYLSKHNGFRSFCYWMLLRHPLLGLGVHAASLDDRICKSSQPSINTPLRGTHFHRNSCVWGSEMLWIPMSPGLTFMTSLWSLAANLSHSLSGDTEYTTGEPISSWCMGIFMNWTVRNQQLKWYRNQQLKIPSVLWFCTNSYSW